MRVFITMPMFLLLALTMPSAQGQNAPAASAPAAAKPADAKTDAKTDTTKVDAKAAAPATAKSTAAAAAARDAKKPADASNKTTTPTVADTKPDAKKPAAGGTPAAAGNADDAASAKTAKADGPLCVVAEFRAIGIDEQDVTKRRSRALSWLQQRSKQCSVEQLLMIRNNRSQWMGTADSAKLASVVDSLLEAIAAENPRVAALLYGTPPPPPPPGSEDKK